MSLSDKDYKAEAQALVIKQYQDAARLRATIDLLCGKAGDIHAACVELEEMLDIDLAFGAHLDTIGEIVGISRIVPEAIPISYFGFDDTPDAGTFGELNNTGIGAQFYNLGDPLNASTVLKDNDYRLVIRAKITRNHAHGTGDDIIAALNYIFNADASIAEDAGPMAINLGIPRQLTTTERAIITVLDLLPRPAGVKINSIISFAGDTGYFGFSDTPGALGFGELGVPGVGGTFAEIIA